MCLPDFRFCFQSLCRIFSSFLVDVCLCILLFALSCSIIRICSFDATVCISSSQRHRCRRHVSYAYISIHINVCVCVCVCVLFFIRSARLCCAFILLSSQQIVHIIFVGRISSRAKNLPNTHTFTQKHTKYFMHNNNLSSGYYYRAFSPSNQIAMLWI